MNKYLKTIKDYFEEIRKEMPEVTNEILCDEGDGETIYYMNGNDSTPFDWDCNNRLCEFMMFYKSTEMGFIKLLINKRGLATAYLYKEDYDYGDEPIRKEMQLFSPEQVRELKGVLIKAENKGCYDKPISKLEEID